METFPCSKCGVEKSPSDYHYATRADGTQRRRRQCRQCMALDCKKREAGETPEQRAARRARAKAWAEANVDKKRASREAWWSKNKDLQKRVARNRNLLIKYGITIEDYEALVEEQDGRCAACGSTDTGSRFGVFHVDHCHKTGKVRALLCLGCNVALGAVNDDASRMLALVKYLRRHGEATT